MERFRTLLWFLAVTFCALAAYGQAPVVRNLMTTNHVVDTAQFDGKNDKVSITNIQNYLLSGLPFNPTNTFVCFEGDSITANANGYWWWLSNTFKWNNILLYTNSAHAGDGLNDVTNRWFTTMAQTMKHGPGTNALMFLWVGINNYTDTLLTSTPTNFCNQLSNFWRVVQSSNIQVCAFTITSRDTFNGDSQPSKTNQFIINEFIRHSGIPDYVIDTQAMFGNNFDPYYFPDDHVHPGTNAHYIIAQTVDRIVRTGTHNYISQGPSIFGTNQEWFSPQGVPLWELNRAGYNARTPGNLFAGTLVTSNLVVLTSNGIPFLITISDNGGLFPKSLVTPTNIPNARLLAWYKPSMVNGYVTNAGVATMVDLSTNAWDLTNRGSATSFPIGRLAIQNGMRGVQFNGANSTYLKSVLPTNSQPTTVVMVLANTNIATGRYIMDSVNSLYRQFYLFNSAATADRIGTVANDFTTVQVQTNRFLTYTLVFNGAASGASTNGVAGVVGDVGAGTLSGITLGTSFNQSAAHTYTLLEMAFFGTNLPAAYLNGYLAQLTNTYNLALP